LEFERGDPSAGGTKERQYHLIAIRGFFHDLRGYPASLSTG